MLFAVDEENTDISQIYALVVLLAYVQKMHLNISLLQAETNRFLAQICLVAGFHVQGALTCFCLPSPHC